MMRWNYEFRDGIFIGCLCSLLIIVCFVGLFAFGAAYGDSACRSELAQAEKFK